MTRTLTTIVTTTMLLASCGQPTDQATTEPPTAASLASVASDSSAKSASGVGTVTAVDPSGLVTIAHGPIPAVGWPAMTMGFTASSDVMTKATVGDRVRFDFIVNGDATTVTAIRPE